MDSEFSSGLKCTTRYWVVLTTIRVLPGQVEFGIVVGAGFWRYQPTLETNGLMLRAVSNHQHMLNFCFHTQLIEFNAFFPL